jgi:hypothetical protein
MHEFSYSDEKIDRFHTTYTVALETHTSQQKEFGDKTGAYADFEKLFSLAKEEYGTLRKLAKIALKNNPQMLDQLGLNKNKVKDIAGIFSEMQRFYDIALKEREIIEALSQFSYSEKKINQCRESFVAAGDAQIVYYKENSEAVEATRVRDAKMADLDVWMGEFYAICKIALAQRPDLMDKISAN